MQEPLWTCIPFVGMLLCIALFPILNPSVWERRMPVITGFWSILAIVLLSVKYGIFSGIETAADGIVNDYLTFIVLLFGLYCVAGNIRFEGDLAGSPRVNVLLLLVGTLLSSFIGTTGSSMLMIRPVIQMNSWRSRRSHIMIFFIFLISNLGGCLTPVGDPPLLMGFMQGVPFLWSFRLFPIMMINAFILLFIFYRIDRKAYRKDIEEGYRPNLHTPETSLKIEGLHNLLFLVMIIFAVLISGILPNYAAFKGKGIPITKTLMFPLTSIVEVAIILFAAWLSFKTTPIEVRRRNHFTWGAIQEVAVLFIGIFITMQPALIVLKHLGPQMDIDKPYQMFVLTGLLSSFLDNTPTYMVFLTTAGSLHFAHGISTLLGTVPVNMLEAISCGAVFMGANTYIGNAPNFMVKSMSDENGIRMPSFFGYMKWSVCILCPVYLLDILLFFH